MNLTDVVQRCALSRSAARRFLHTLIGLGYITQHGSQYELTPQVLELGNSYLPKLSVADLVRPHTEALSRELGSSISVGVLDGVDVRYIARINAPSALMVAIRVGSRIPAHRTGLGRILLAALPQHELDAYLSDAGRASGPRRLSSDDRAILLRALDTTRKQGWCYVDQLLEVGVRAVAVPLHSRDGELVAAMSASLHDAKMSKRNMIEQFVPRLQERGARIGLELRGGIEF
jgi:IclR family pca regulon transcriptional regulator